MSTDLHAAVPTVAIDDDFKPGRRKRRRWLETALVIAVTFAAVMLVSFFSVVKGLS